jgi:prophage DNA circulation protein
MSWRNRLRPASFRGVQFHLETDSQGGGRAIVMSEFPNKDIPVTEDLGRRARRYPVAGYLIGPNYDQARDALIAAFETDGAGLLVHPMLGESSVRLATYSMTERRERGAFVEFQAEFVEAGSEPSATPRADTQARVMAAADALGKAAAEALNAQLRALLAGQTVNI